MAKIGRYIKEGDFPHAMDYYSSWIAAAGGGYVAEGVLNECEPGIVGADTIVVGPGSICLGRGDRRTRTTSDEIVLPLNESDYDRYDVIYLVDDGEGGWEIYSLPAAVVGTPSEEPKHNDLPLPHVMRIVPICIVYWEGMQADPEITEIKDCRSILLDWMYDKDGIRYEWFRESAFDTGIGLKAKSSAGSDAALFNILSSDDSPRLLVEEDGILGTSNDEIRVGIETDGSGGSIVAHEDNIGDGLEYSSKFKTALASVGGLGYDAGRMKIRSGDGLSISPENELDVRLGDGLEFTGDNRVENTIRNALDLEDTPGDYTGNRTKVLAVNWLENGLEFKGVSKLDSLYDDDFHYKYVFSERIIGDTYPPYGYYGTWDHGTFEGAIFEDPINGRIELGPWDGSDSHAFVRKTISREMGLAKRGRQMSFSYQRAFRTTIVKEDAIDGRAIVFMGWAYDGFDYRGAGFLLENKNIYAIAGDIHQNVTSYPIGAFHSGIPLDLMVLYNPLEEKIYFYVDGTVLYVMEDAEWITPLDIFAGSLLEITHDAGPTSLYFNYFEFWQDGVWS